MTFHDLPTLVALDAILQQEAVRTRIAPIVSHVERKMSRDSAATMAWETIPLSVYGEALPGVIRSSWVFILRAGAITGAERHPNSHQRLMSYRATGDLQTWEEGRWRSNSLVSDGSARLEERWVSVPPNVWHQAVVSNEDWVVVSFHTAAAQELIEERPDANDNRLTHQRLYLPEQAEPSQ